LKPIIACSLLFLHSIIIPALVRSPLTLRRHRSKMERMHKVLLIYDDYTELNNVQTTLKKIGFDCVGISSEFSTNQQVLSFNPDVVVGFGKGTKVSSVGVGKRLKEMPRWNGKTVLIFSAGVKPKPEDLLKIRMDVVLEAPVPINRLVQVLASLTGQDDKALLNKLALKTQASLDSAKQAAKDAQKAKSQDSVFVSGGKDQKGADVQVQKGTDPAAKRDAASGEFKNDPDFIVAKGATPDPDADKKVEVEPSAADVTPEKMRVNWDEFTTEIFGKTTKPANSALDVTPEDAKRHQTDLKIAAKTMGDRIKRYDKYTKNLLLAPDAGLKKTETRKVQRELMKEWKMDEIQSQDELRREFTKALFRNKK
jgi:hypothetical protein